MARTWRQHLEDFHGWGFPADTSENELRWRHEADHSSAIELDPEIASEGFTTEDHTDDHQQVHDGDGVDTPDEDDLTWAREDLGPSATSDEVYEVAQRRVDERRQDK